MAISSGGIQAFEEFVLARYFMFIQVYFHKTRRYFDRLLIEGIKEILPNGKFPENVDDYLKWDDVRVIYEMRRLDNPFSQQYLKRKVMTCVFETPAHAKQGEKMFVRSLLDIAKMNFPNAQFKLKIVSIRSISNIQNREETAIWIMY